MPSGSTLTKLLPWNPVREERRLKRELGSTDSRKCQFSFRRREEALLSDLGFKLCVAVVGEEPLVPGGIVLTKLSLWNLVREEKHLKTVGTW